MMALDTNVLVRFLVADDPEQTRRARRRIEKAVAQGETLHLTEIALVETVWVLERGYRFQRPDIAIVLRKLLSARQLSFSSTDRLVRALSRYEKGKGGFADYLLCESSLEAGCEAVLTFDEALLKERGFLMP